MRTEAPLVFAQGEFFQLEVIYKENPSLLTSIEHIFFLFWTKDSFCDYFVSFLALYPFNFSEIDWNRGKDGLSLEFLVSF